jgi:hypothetical protein
MQLPHKILNVMIWCGYAQHTYIRMFPTITNVLFLGLLKRPSIRKNCVFMYFILKLDFQL